MDIDNPAAFPCTGEGFNSPHYTQHGMTLRDWFAGQALAAIAGEKTPGSVSAEDFAEGAARASYLIADAMLAERAKSS